MLSYVSILLAIIIMHTHRLNNTDNQYLDANDVTVSTENFGSILSITDFSDIFPDDPTAGTHPAEIQPLLEPNQRCSDIVPTY